MADTKRKTLVYKRASFSENPGDDVTLESLLRKGLRKVRGALNRAQSAGIEEKERRFVNHHSTSQNENGDTQILGCEILSYEMGAQPVLVSLGAESEELDLEALPAQAGKELLGGSVYLGVLGNHVVAVQSKGLTLRDTEDYLNWLLREKSEVLPEQIIVTLDDCPPRKKRIGGIKKISFISPLKIVPEVARGGGPRVEARSFLTKLTGPGFAALKAALGGIMDLGDEISVEDLAQLPDLSVRLSLEWHARRGEDDNDFMDAVARQFRNYEEPYEIQTTSGKITNEDFKLQQPKNIRWGSMRPDWDDIFPKMAEWLAKLISDDMVRA